jgi:hypothetical protein
MEGKWIDESYKDLIRTNIVIFLQLETRHDF